jgi:hypothetical protein
MSTQVAAADATNSISVETYSKLYWIAMERLIAGNEQGAIVQQYADGGVPPGIAEMVVRQAAAAKPARVRKLALIDVGFGLGLFLVAVVLSVIAFQFARAMHAPVFLIAGGAVVAGLVTTLKGLWHLITG